MTENKNGFTGLVLTKEQIKELAEFAEEVGQSVLRISHGCIGLFDEDGAAISTEYKGLIALSPDGSYTKLGPMQSDDPQGLKVILTAKQAKDQAGSAVNIAELSVSLSLDDSKIKEQLKDPVLQRLLNYSLLKRHLSEALGESKKDIPDTGFKFPLGLTVKTDKGEIGHVRRIVMSDNGCVDYLVRYKEADGPGAEKWFGENELSHGRDLRTGTVAIS